MKRGGPIKRKSHYKPVEVERFHSWVAAHGCLLTGRDATIHHVTGYADRPGRIARSEWLVVPLAPEFHLIQHGPRHSVEAIGHQGFFRVHGIDLMSEAQRLQREWIERRKDAA